MRRAGESSNPEHVRRYVLKRAWRYLAPWRAPGYRAAGVIAVESALAIVPAVLVGALTRDLAKTPVPFGHVAGTAAVAAAAAIGASLLGAVGTVMLARAAESVGAQLREDVFEHLVGQTIDFHTRTR